VRLMLEGHADELEKSLEQRMQTAAANEQFELAGRYRDLVITLHQLQEKQRIAAASDDDADVFGFHYEKGMLAANLFHIRNGRIVDRREFFWEDLPEFPEAQALDAPQPEVSPVASETSANPGDSPAEASDTLIDSKPEKSSPAETFAPAVFFSALLKQLYIDQQYVPRNIYVPVDFTDRVPLTELLCEHTAHKVEIAVPQRGEKRSLLDLAGQNAKQSYDQRFRVLQPSIRVIQETLQDVLNLPALPERIECFDISHIQGAETVASMVVWEKGAMNKSEYRKFQIKSVEGVDDFASMREVVTRRYRRLQEEHRPMPSLILIDGGLGQLHAAASALEELSFTSQPLAAIAKREEVIYVYGQEDDPVVLDRHSPVLHLVQRIRDESHRFAVTYHRKRREMRDRDSDLLRIPGVGAQTRNRLITHFGSLRAIQFASLEALQSVVSRKVAQAICAHFQASVSAGEPPEPR
jgi:excinuclease ABC subunit C